MTTGATLVQDSLYAAQVLGQDQSVTTGDSDLVLRIMNRLVDSWAIMKSMIRFVNTETFTMTANVGDYSTSLLPGGRPTGVDSIAVILNNIEYPVELINNQQFSDITYKQVPAIPAQCYYDNLFPNAQFHFFPLPYAAFTCSVDVRRPITGAIASATSVVLPSGYERALIARTAIELCPYFGKAATKDMRDADTDATRAIEIDNYTPLVMASGLEHGYSVNNDFPYRGF